MSQRCVGTASAEQESGSGNDKEAQAGNAKSGKQECAKATGEPRRHGVSRVPYSAPDHDDDPEDGPEPEGNDARSDSSDDDVPYTRVGKPDPFKGEAKCKVTDVGLAIRYR